MNNNMDLAFMQMAKKTLRKEVLAKRRGLSAEAIHAESIKITEFLCTWPIFTQSNTVMVFLSMKDEIETQEILKYALAAGKKVCVPLIGEEPGIMQAVLVKSLNDLVKGKYDILTVAEDKIKAILPKTIDLILVPGVAFSRAGMRCGMGAGYYDRFLPKASNAVLAGLCLACQLVEKIPCDDFDQPVQYLITADGIITCN